MLFGGSMQRTKKNHGFTLIELMVTIAVMAIIAMLAAPSFADLIAKQRLESTTKQLLNILTTARSQAILLRQATTVNLDSSNPDTGTVLNGNVISGGANNSLTLQGTGSSNSSFIGTK